MNETSRALHRVSTPLLAVGFIGTAIYAVDVNFGSTDGGANIGLGVMVLFCIFAGSMGLLAGLISVILRVAKRSEAASRREQ